MIRQSDNGLCCDDVLDFDSFEYALHPIDIIIGYGILLMDFITL